MEISKAFKIKEGKFRERGPESLSGMEPEQSRRRVTLLRFHTSTRLRLLSLPAPLRLPSSAPCASTKIINPTLPKADYSNCASGCVKLLLLLKDPYTGTQTPAHE